MQSALDSTMRWRREARACRESFAGEPQRRTLARLRSARRRAVSARDVVAGHRHHALPLGQLHLEHHHGLLAEGHLGRGEIELPHPHEALVVEPLDLLAMGEEALAPVLQRLGVVQAQDLDVGDQEPARSTAGSTSDSAGM